MKPLPVPEVVRCYFDEAFDPHLPAMCLRWDPLQQDKIRNWCLPEGLNLRCGLPTRFGISIQRISRDTYCVRLLWDRLCLFWHSLARSELVNCDLGPVLTALGTDLWYLLDQPIEYEVLAHPRAA